MTDIAKVEEKWSGVDWQAHYRTGWCTFPGLMERVFERLCGSPVGDQREMLQHLVGSQLASGNVHHAGRVQILELGCGQLPLSGHIQLPDLTEGLLDATCMDISQACLDSASKAFTDLHLERQDLNHLDLGGRRFDLCIVAHFAHHIENLGHLFTVIAKALAPTGLLYMNDYIGPRWLHFDKSDLDLGREYLLQIPEEQRRKVDGTIKTYPFAGSTKEALAQTDPSEACRSDEIVPVMLRSFRPASMFGYGTLLYMVLQGIAQNFPDNEDSRSVLDWLWDEECRLLLSGELSPWLLATIGRVV
ncbi:MAG TPA: class I SAM-dependent methyltransferase [bacterium]|nr:class I SAM-dependent methyltransferase [bacterium]